MGGASGVEKILLLITDVTEARERERSETEQREQLAMFQQMVKDRAELTAYLAECERLAAVVLANPPTDRETLLRALHTLKGNMAIRGIESVAKACHALEEELRQPSETLSPPDWAGFADTWAAFAARVHDLTRAVPEDRIELTRPELHSVRDAAAAGASPERLAAMLSALELEPAAHRLEHLAEDARRLADRLGKGGLTVTIEADDLRFDRRRWAPFWAAFVHMLRNAIDHGIEPPDERLAQGKSRAGCVALRAQRGRDGVLVIEIADDGRGIDWQAIRTRVQALGRSATTELRAAGGASRRRLLDADRRDRDVGPGGRRRRLPRRLFIAGRKPHGRDRPSTRDHVPVHVPVRGCGDGRHDGAAGPRGATRGSGHAAENLDLTTEAKGGD